MRCVGNAMNPASRRRQALLRRTLAALVAIASIRAFAADTAAAETAVALELCVLVGAPGEPSYAERFARAAATWAEAARRGGGRVTTIGLEPGNDDRANLEAWLHARRTGSDPPLWLVYLGHGSYDGRDARLNLRGPDVTAAELATWLRDHQRPIVLVHGGSAAAPFLAALSGPGRIIISATRSGHEVNYARFGEYFARAVASPEADIDQDGQASVLESFVTAARQVQQFYDENGRLATEHALIDDNGDGQGTPGDWFRGTRSTRRAESGAPADGERARLVALVPPENELQLSAAQRERRDQLEDELTALRTRRDTMPAPEYDTRLEHILRELGRIYGMDS